jgi:hypothetical protein
MENDLPGNPYEDEYENAPVGKDAGPAVMALAYEQRTANLLAMLAQQPTDTALAAIVERRLGLGA